MDRNYYDMKDYVRHRINRHEKKSHIKVEVEVEAEAEAEEPESSRQETADVTNVSSQLPPPTEHIIIIDENTVFSDDE
jgi:hypothetical protein